MDEISLLGPGRVQHAQISLRLRLGPGALIVGEQTAGRGVEPREQPFPGLVELDVIGGKAGIGADFLVGFGGGMGAVECRRDKRRGMAIRRCRRPDCEIVAGQLIGAPAIEVSVIISIENFVARQHPQTVALPADLQQCCFQRRSFRAGRIAAPGHLTGEPSVGT